MFFRGYLGRKALVKPSYLAKAKTKEKEVVFVSAKPIIVGSSIIIILPEYSTKSCHTK